MPGSERVSEVPRPPLTLRITARQWLAIDVVAAAAAALVMACGLRLMHSPHFAPPSVPVALAALAATLPVAVRRFWPLPVLVVVVTAIAVLTALGRAPLGGSDLMLGMAVYTAALSLPRPVAAAALVATEGAIGAGLLAATATARLPNLLLHGMLTAAAMWFVGDGVRERRRYQAGVAQQEEQRRAAEEERSARAAEQERLRIARELHDVLAHTLSVVTVQAGVGRRVGAARPAEALRALSAVEESSRGALDELRRILCLMRGDDDPGDGTGAPGREPAVPPGPVLAPAPGLADLANLAAMVRSAGTPVTLTVDGDVASVPVAASLTAYRITQEALTNVVRHAPGATAAVLVAIGADGVRIRVTNDGGGLAAGTGTGTGGPGGSGQHGIIGMRERAAAFGGHLKAGAAPGGGFAVTAFLPVQGGRQAA
jgi:signal transduction histidine kinase